MIRAADGSAGDVDYAKFGRSYADFRRPDARIAKAVNTHLGQARTVLNVGAGTGSYEPRNRLVTPLEPSASITARGPRSGHRWSGRVPCICQRLFRR